ncbi:hypothetical protein JCM17380_29930 [Desulfosporosinus burensis]
MRIDRIRSENLVGLGNVDWIFSSGPFLLLFQNKSIQKLFSDLLLTLFYNQKKSAPFLTQNRNGLIEVWMSGESHHFYLRHEFIKKDDALEQLSTLMDETEQPVNLPESMTIGEYVFKVQLHDFLRGGIVDWPETDHNDYLFRRINNLRQGGEEGLSLTKVRASILGAQKRVKEQSESMALLKTEYDALRHEWEIAYRQQDNQRLLQIDIKNLLEKEMILTEKITSSANIQKRLEVHSQNPDYRELLRLQDELNRLAERLQGTETNLWAISSESCVDWALIESLREECMEWACLQKNVDLLVAGTQLRTRQIAETQNYLQTSGYKGLLEDEDQILRRSLEARDVAQEKLNKLIITKRGLDKLQVIFSQESTRLANFVVMDDVTEADEIRIAQREKYLQLWRSSKLANTLDRTMRKWLGLTGIAGMLSSRLLDYYKRYQASNYQEFTNQLEEFRDQTKRVESVKKQVEKLQNKVRQEENLHRIVRRRNEVLQRAFTAVHTKDFSEWLRGWEDYRQRKHQLSIELNELQLELEKQQKEEIKLLNCAEQLRNKIQNWRIPSTDREEVLAAVLNVASLLRDKDEMETEVAELSKRFYGLLGDRNMEQLTKVLEPLAELEREIRLPNEERLAEISAWQIEQKEIRQRLAVAKQRLQSTQTSQSLSVLEKKIDTMKHQWMAYEDLRHALDDAYTLLELSWSEWQTKHEKILSIEKQWIFEHSFSASTPKSIEAETLAKRNYFSYRMAVAQLVLRDNTETPLFFSVGKVKIVDKDFWREVTEYLYKLSPTRQVIFSTTDLKLGEKLSSKGWSLFCLPLS